MGETKAGDDATMVVITGPVGSGKSTTAAMLHDLLSAARIPSAFIDMDYLRDAWPAHSPFNSEVGVANLQAIVANYRAIGIDCFILADVVETHEQRDVYRGAAPGASVVIVRLRVPLDVIAARLKRRQTPDSLKWYLARAPELEEIFTRRQIGDVVIDAGHRGAAEIAHEIFDRLDLGARPRLDP